tara:strand:- start:13 stop:672 length:660 start_codon:yes stop_codon:yes gene_type:complete
MKRLLPLISVVLLVFFSSCEREVEEAQVDFGFDYQPLEVGLFWVYEVDQTIYYGENDTERESFFYEDLIKSFYINEDGEQVFIVDRSKSLDNVNWSFEYAYTLIQRDLCLVRTLHNQPVVTLVFPPKDGVVWNGNIYRNEDVDEFVLKRSNTTIHVNQEDSDDLVTYRDIRYEVYDQGVGLVEKYDEVLTYCSRNDCLGDMLIDSGYKILMKLSDYGKN